MELFSMDSTKQIGQELKSLASAGLTVQSHCVSVQQQPLFILPADIAKDLPDINTYLRSAQANAGQYLTQVQPKIISVITDVDAYSKTFPTFAKQINGYIRAWASGSDDNKKKAMNAIAAMRDIAREKSGNVAVVSGLVGSTLTLFNSDVSHFEEVSRACETRITGKKGELAELDAQISSLNSKIAGASVGVGLSGLALIGGIFMICIGAIANFVTAGTSTTFVVIGASLAVAGAGGLTGSSIVLANLIRDKGKLLDRKAVLDAYVAAITGVQDSVGGLHDSAQSAADCAGSMQRAWDLFGGDLKQVENTLTYAQSFSDLPSSVQGFFETAENQWNSVSTDIDIIKQQMTGVQVKKLSQNTLLAAGMDSGCGWGRISGDAVLSLVS